MVQDKSLDELKQKTNLHRLPNCPEDTFFLHPISSAKINIDVQM